ncbi:MAG: hypothetical protein Q8927_19730 [Bacteroidota bacterium]|nr:hypothetical protein [Bacteroidota bacterium]MDP4247576.1 hypothetical protein [Bacteroidota bacterium]MDP4259648.1 hypothetical protein [Bacteroidota bacterium]
MKMAFALLALILLMAACKKNDISPPPPVKTDTLKLISTTYIPGNQVKNAQDTFDLLFNHPVTINSIQLQSNGCLPDFKFNTTNKGRTVQFYNFLCGGLGGDYTFLYTVTDSVNVRHSGSVSFHCYTRRINFSGSVISYFLSKDNNYCWVLTGSPAQLLCVGITDTGYRKSWPLAFTPFKAVLNGDNNKLYILSGDYGLRDTIFVMDPGSGAIVKKIAVPRSSDGMEEFPVGLAFGANGYGMLNIEDENFNPSWLVIDSRKNDTLYRHPSLVVGSVPYGLFSFKMCYPNFDGSKVMGLELYGSCRLVVLDCNTHALSELAFPPSPQCNSNYFVLNKLIDQIFMGNIQPDGDVQFLVSNGSIVGSSDFDGYGGSEADFDYRSNGNDYVWYYDNQVFGLVNYAGGAVLSMYGFAPSIDDIAATTDGKYIVTRGNSSLVLFDTGMF